MKLKYDGPLSKFASNCSLRHYTKGAAESVEAAAVVKVVKPVKVITAHSHAHTAVTHS